MEPLTGPGRTGHSRYSGGYWSLKVLLVLLVLTELTGLLVLKVFRVLLVLKVLLETLLI